MGFRFFRSTVFFTGENIPVRFRRAIIETLDQKREVTLWLERKKVPGHFLCEWATNKGGIANDGSKSSSKVGCLEEAFFLSTSYRWSSRNTTSFCWSETRVEQGLPPGKVRPWSLRKNLWPFSVTNLPFLQKSSRGYTSIHDYSSITIREKKYDDAAVRSRK